MKISDTAQCPASASHLACCKFTLGPCHTSDCLNNVCHKHTKHCWLRRILMQSQHVGIQNMFWGHAWGHGPIESQSLVHRWGKLLTMWLSCLSLQHCYHTWTEYRLVCSLVIQCVTLLLPEYSPAPTMFLAKPTSYCSITTPFLIEILKHFSQWVA